MKKLFIILIISVLLLTISACNVHNQPIVPANITNYYLDINFDKSDSFILAKQKVEYTNNSSDTLNEIYFHLYANAYRREALTPAFENDINAYGSIDITSVKANDSSTPITYLNNGTLLKVLPQAPIKPLSSITVELEYKVSIPRAPLRLGRYDRTINMGNFYPILAVYEKGEWRLDPYSRIGDPFYSEISNFDVKITCNRNYIIASSGNLVNEEYKGSDKIAHYKQANIRDFAFVMSKDFLVKSKEVNQTKVNYFYYLDKSSDANLEIAANALLTFENAFGNYPYENYNVVETSFIYGGMEYPALSLINANIKDKADVIIHETAHQWFSCLIGSDSVRQPYLDEGLATFSNMYYYMLNGDKEKYDEMAKNLRNSYISFTMIENAKTPGYKANLTKSIYDFKSAYEYEIIAYNKSAIMFTMLLETKGEKEFQNAMKAYYINYCYKNSNINNLIATFTTKKFNAEKIIIPFLEGDTVITTLKYKND